MCSVVSTLVYNISDQFNNFKTLNEIKNVVSVFGRLYVTLTILNTILYNYDRDTLKMFFIVLQFLNYNLQNNFRISEVSVFNKVFSITLCLCLC